MKKLQYNQEIRFITKDGKSLDCYMFDNFDAVIRYYRDGVGHESNSEQTVFGMQHAHGITADGNNRPWADEQIEVHEGDTVIYRDERYTANYLGNYSDALRFVPEK